MIRYLAIIIGLLVLAISACKEKNHEKIVAEAYGNQLYESELQRLIGKQTTTEDSVFVAKEYINSWIKNQIILHESESVLTDQEKDKSRALEQYKNDLLVYETLNKLAIQRIDSNFSDEELNKYYEENIDEFELAENIIKIMFYKIANETDELDQLWVGFQKSDEESLDKLAKLAANGGNSYTDTTSWVFFNDILKEIPINTYNQEHFLDNNKNIKIKEGSDTYFVKILDFRTKSSTSPFEMERDRIKKILFVKRQKQTLQVVETELLDKAYNNSKVIIH